MSERPGLRLDRLLVYLRFCRSRTLARTWVEEGHFRRNGVRVLAADQCVYPGDVLTMPRRSGVLVIEISGLPERRGSPEAAQAHYRVLDPARPIAIAGGTDRPAGGRKQEGPAAP